MKTDTLIELEIKEIINTMRFQFERGVTWFTFFVTLNGTLIVGVFIGLINKKDGFNKESQDFIFIDLQRLIVFTSILLIISCYLGIKLGQKTRKGFIEMEKRMNEISEYLKNNSTGAYNFKSPLYKEIYMTSFNHMRNTMIILIFAWLFCLIVSIK